MGNLVVVDFELVDYVDINFTKVIYKCFIESKMGINFIMMDSKYLQNHHSSLLLHQGKFTKEHVVIINYSSTKDFVNPLDYDFIPVYLIIH